MRVRVTNKRPVSVTIGGRSFRPRSSTELEVDARGIRQIRARYGMVVEELVDVVAPPAPPAAAIICPDCGDTFRTEGGLKSHRHAKHEES
jgi:hypothetical protein